MRTRQPDIPLIPSTKWGNCGGAGGGITDPGSGDWTSVRTALGVYSITFSKPFANIPVVVATAHYGGGGCIATQIQSRTATGFIVAVANPSGQIDSNVMWAAYGLVKG